VVLQYKEKINKFRFLLLNVQKRISIITKKGYQIIRDNESGTVWQILTLSLVVLESCYSTTE